MGARNSRIKRRQCKNKVQHDDQTEAVKALIKAKSDGATGMHTYKCPHCGKWHIGHRPRGRRRGKRK